MSKIKAPKAEKALTEVELEMMNIIWDRASCTIKDVHNALPAERALAYTSVATIVNILETKKFLKSKKGERANIYMPLVSREEYEKLSLNDLANKMFHGEPKNMVMRLLDASDMSTNELESIRQFIEKRLQK